VTALEKGVKTSPSHLPRWRGYALRRRCALRREGSAARMVAPRTG
jgi:hypothetical protein